MWNSTIVVLAVLVILLCASAAGMVLQSALRERHKSCETADHIRLIISILVTFAAVLLGLLITNVKTSLDTFDSRLRGYVGDITELDMRLREYGDDAAPIRANRARISPPRSPIPGGMSRILRASIRRFKTPWASSANRSGRCFSTLTSRFASSIQRTTTTAASPTCSRLG